MIEEISSLVGKDAFTAKSLANGSVRINATSVDDFQKIIAGLRDKNTHYFTYQLKTERALKVVIRNLHHSLEPKDIKDALEADGYKVRNVANIVHWRTKDPLPLFFVDLEPTDESKNIYQLKTLLHTRIVVESPRPKNDIAQCKKCQQYGHTRTYCTLPIVCVKCGDNHDNRECTKKPDDKPKCGPCGGNHPANYKGCPECKKIAKKPISKARPKINQSISNLTHPHLLFADAVSNRDPAARNNDLQPQSNTNRLEQLMEQLVNQNAQILGLLTTLINKLT